MSTARSWDMATSSVSSRKGKQVLVDTVNLAPVPKATVSFYSLWGGVSNFICHLTSQN